jgi:uncharacterized membrane protein YoaT (DUF817 family)
MTSAYAKYAVAPNLRYALNFFANCYRAKISFEILRCALKLFADYYRSEENIKKATLSVAFLVVSEQ